jgi:hypothetical protein
MRAVVVAVASVIVLGFLKHVVQRLMRAVQVGGRDLTDQLAIAS